MTQLEIFTALANKMPDAFVVGHDAAQYVFYAKVDEGTIETGVSVIELLRFNADGKIIKASADSWEYIMDRLGIEFEVVKSVLVNPDTDPRIAIERGSEWYMRWWNPLKGAEYCKHETSASSFHNKMEVVNETAPLIIEAYLNTQKE